MNVEALLRWAAASQEKKKCQIYFVLYGPITKSTLNKAQIEMNPASQKRHIVPEIYA